MKTQSELKKDIINISMKIHQELPELSSSVEEISIVVSAGQNNGVTIKTLEEYYSSLVNLVSSYLKKHDGLIQTNYTQPNMHLTNRIYPNSKGIYNQKKNEVNLSLSNSYYGRMPNAIKKPINEKDFNHKISDEDLNIPGSALNHQQKLAHSEDEENNYYSLGGDRYTNPNERYQLN